MWLNYYMQCSWFRYRRLLENVNLNMLEGHTIGEIIKIIKKDKEMNKKYTLRKNKPTTHEI